MADRPIIFSGPMVKALIAGDKTQTCRKAWRDCPKCPGVPGCKTCAGVGILPTIWQKVKPGDRLWVRETWAHYQTINYVRRSGGRAFSEVSDGLAIYRADGHDTIEDARNHIRLMSGVGLEAVEINGDRWRPSIHMPRWASRLTLIVTEKRLERVQNISHADVIAEGASNCVDDPLWFPTYWEELHGPGAWDENPEVVAISFRCIKANIDAMETKSAAHG